MAGKRYYDLAKDNRVTILVVRRFNNQLVRLGILPKALKRRKPMTSELSQHDKDFAHAMALKLRLYKKRKDVRVKKALGDCKMEIALLVVCIFMMHFH